MRKTREPSKDLPPPAEGDAAVRALVCVSGLVQGVGFRPFVYGLAQKFGLRGYVCNAVDGVHIEVEGPPDRVLLFLTQLWEAPPLHAVIEHIDSRWIPCVGGNGFEILHSEDARSMATQVLPDIATCPACLAELMDPADRRYRYPFLNCTHCGPRYSIIRRAPYDRHHTTMARFAMCADCAKEYEDPRDRRFHAQPTACMACGPMLAWWDAEGNPLHEGDEALEAGVKALQEGQIVALKGLGGFQLLCDARNDDAVAALRERKERPAKPFAVMFPHLEAIRRACVVSEMESQLLQSPQAPIVLLKAQDDRDGLSDAIAPGGALVGAMLPCTPLHHLLMASAGMPLVATSGNLSDEPICTDEDEALERLAGIADAYLVHDRPIARAVDDSVTRVIGGTPVVFRNARGYAPASLRVPAAIRPVLAVGGHLKNTVAIAHNGHIVLSQHIGDLDTTAAVEAFEETVEDLCALYGIVPEVVVADLHPDYRSTRAAEASGLPVLRVQHHYAHVLSCMAEHGLEGPVLGIAWDGTGYGPDGTVWGGEFLASTVHGYERRAHLLPFRLPGGERAMREPRRAGMGLLHEAYKGDWASMAMLPTLADMDRSDVTVLSQMMDTGLHAPVTTSAGRLFDGIASMLGLCQKASFEGEAAMMLEAAASGRAKPYDISIVDDNGVLVLDWRPMVRAIAEDVLAGVSAGGISAGFHAALAEAAAETAARLGLSTVVLTGGCFQNARLYETMRARLEVRELTVHGHSRVPPNDGGIAVGQVYFAVHQPES